MLKEYIFKFDSDKKNILSVLLTFNEELTLKLDNDDFQLNCGIQELEFDIITHDKKNYELFLKERILIQNLTLFYNLLDIKGSIITETIFLKPEIKEQDKDKLTFLKEHFIGIKYYDKKIRINFNEEITGMDSLLTIKKYDINTFNDFEIDSIELLPNDNSTSLYFEFEYQFEKDFIYQLEFELENEFIEFNYLKGKPSIYFTSIYFLNSLMKNYEINLTLLDTFDLQLMIWKQSLIALSKAGLSYKLPLDLTPDEEALFGEYVTNKIILSKITGFFINRFVPGSEAETDIKSKSLGTYTVVKASDSTDNQKFKHLNDLITKLEEQLMELSRSRSSLTYDNYVTYPNRTNLYRGKYVKKSI